MSVLEPHKKVDFFTKANWIKVIYKLFIREVKRKESGLFSPFLKPLKALYMTTRKCLTTNITRDENKRTKPTSFSEN